MKARLWAVTIVAVMGFLSMTAVASAKSTKAKAPIYGGDPYCVPFMSYSSIGTTTLKRTGNTVAVSIKLKKGRPNTAYNVFLLEVGSGSECAFIAFGGELKTNAKGKGKAALTTEVPAADTEFEVELLYGEAAGEQEESPPIKLP